MYKEDKNKPFSKDISYITADIFMDGIDILEKYLNETHPKTVKLPENVEYRNALDKLLMFILNENHRSLFEENNCEEDLTVKFSQHLLSELSANSSYVMEQNCELLVTDVCPCRKSDKLDGIIGDTSFGCEKGWHGRTDVIIEHLPVLFTTTTTDGTESEDSSLTSIEDRNQLLSQAIVNSFLQCKLKKNILKNFLIPGIRISSKLLTAAFYDCENDVLLESSVLELFSGSKTLNYTVILFLWLTLNYKLFCTGITDEMKQFTAEFYKRVDDHLYIYLNDVTKPVHEQRKSPTDNSSWANNPGKRCKTRNSTVTYMSLPLDFDLC